jgi:hypothetical protein
MHYEKKMYQRADEYQRRELEISRLRAIMSVLPCANNLTVAFGGKHLLERPMILVADNIHVRSFVASGVLKPLIAEDAKIVHVSQG